jgi:hypothetical protein
MCLFEVQHYGAHRPTYVVFTHRNALNFTHPFLMPHTELTTLMFHTELTKYTEAIFVFHARGRAQNISLDSRTYLWLTQTPQTHADLTCVFRQKNKRT